MQTGTVNVLSIDLLAHDICDIPSFRESQDQKQSRHSLLCFQVVLYGQVKGIVQASEHVVTFGYVQGR